MAGLGFRTNGLGTVQSSRPQGRCTRLKKGRPVGARDVAWRGPSAVRPSLARVLVHLVFSTKNRDALIPSALDGELHAYISTVLKHLDCSLLSVGGADDHVHTLYALARTQTIASVT